MRTDAISLDEADNVATVLRAIKAGERIAVACKGAERVVAVVEDVPLCHKISLGALRIGDTVFKYGQPIGVTTQSVAAGAHVHVHNMRSNRAVR